MDDRFAAYTRSASFALTLSSAQAATLLDLVKTRELMAKYSWHRPHEANFGTADDAAVAWSDGTVRALARRGLVDVRPQPIPCTRADVVVPTRAGELVAGLLLEAGFEIRCAPVHLHPDDRIPLRWEGHELVAMPTPPDRRAPAHPDDIPFLSSYRPTVPAGADA
jgi:hypothetical protein